MRQISIAWTLWLVGTAHVGAQSRIADELSCARCTISLRRIATVGANDGPGTLRGPSRIKLDGAGRYWVIHPPDMSLVFDSTGKLFNTPFRMGLGPNEFASSALPIPLPGDSTLAIDLSAGRATVLSPDLRAVRTIPIQQPIGSSIVLRWPDLVVINGYVASRSGRVEPLSTVTFAGGTVRMVRSFGKHPGEELPQIWEVRASLVRARDQVWEVPNTRYRLTLWDTTGAIVRVLERRPSWFSEPTTQSGGPDRPPGPVVSGLAMDEQGLLWVVINVAAPTWRDAWPKISAGTREVPSDAIQREKMYRTIIEVIDPRSARVVARTSLDDYVVAAFPGRKAAIYYTDADGTPHFSIVQLSLERR
ncbi:MAG: hypothetical protein ACRENP_22295 [Longimicrobiales bacterium]